MLSPKCALYGIKTLKFIKHQEASGLLLNNPLASWCFIRMKTPLIEITLVGPLLF